MMCVKCLEQVDMIAVCGKTCWEVFVRGSAIGGISGMYVATWDCNVVSWTMLVTTIDSVSAMIVYFRVDLHAALPTILFAMFAQ